MTKPLQPLSKLLSCPLQLLSGHFVQHNLNVTGVTNAGNGLKQRTLGHSTN